ncbi:hypothetical protein QJS10_CPB15g01770 [Acorus calamus]|uniref:DUF4283 domain-containing protein n=1 Tax=Acorus calamus TaxID=4465 RepID=A0AAV9D3C4_ACOCL|nr:hypothetical protein QJS10_CPB15g01770 [Acorus calamus]
MPASPALRGPSDPPPPLPPDPPSTHSPPLLSSANPTTSLPSSSSSLSLPLALARAGVISSHSLKKASTVSSSTDSKTPPESSAMVAPMVPPSSSPSVPPTATSMEISPSPVGTSTKDGVSPSSPSKVSTQVTGLLSFPPTIPVIPVSLSMVDPSLNKASSSKGILPTPTPKLYLGESSKAVNPKKGEPMRPRRNKINVPLPGVSEEVKLWSSFFSSSDSKRPQTSVEFYTPEVDCSQKVAILEEEEVSEAEEAWGFILVGYVWGKSPVFTPFLQFLKKLWKPKGEIILHLQGNGFFMINFSLEEDLTNVLEGGPWTMDNRPFVIQKWSRNTKMELERLKSIPIWIKFPNLPLHFWSRTCIGKIASLIGTPLYMDTPTAARSRTAFARVCVEIEAGEELPDEVFVQIRNGDREAIRVTYDWKPEACKFCNTFGHDEALCCKKPRFTKAISHISSENGMKATAVQLDDPPFIEVKSKKANKEGTQSSTLKDSNVQNQQNMSSSGMELSRESSLPALQSSSVLEPALVNSLPAHKISNTASALPSCPNPFNILHTDISKDITVSLGCPLQFSSDQGGPQTSAMTEVASIDTTPSVSPASGENSKEKILDNVLHSPNILVVPTSKAKKKKKGSSADVQSESSDSLVSLTGAKKNKKKRHLPSSGQSKATA